MNKRGVLGLFQTLFLRSKSYDNPYLELSLLSAKDIMTADVITISKSKYLAEAAHTMIGAHVSCVVVTQGREAIGIITERDFIKKLNMDKSEKTEKTVDEFMSKNLKSAELSTSLFQIIKMMSINNIRKMLIMKDKELLGILTQTDLCKAVNSMTTCIIDAPLISDVMTRKLLVASPDDSIASTKKLMAQKDMGSVIVTKKDSIEGIFTEYDIVSEYFMNPNKLKSSRLNDVMTSPVVCVSPDFDLVFANKLMLEKGFRRLPVIQDDKIVGMITQTDVARKLYAHLEKNKDTKYPKYCKLKNPTYNIVKKGSMIIYVKK